MNVRGLLLLLGCAAFAATPARPVVAATGEPGAVLPWTTYEAEGAKTTGVVLGPDFTGRTPAREASGRRCVRLDATGQFLEFSARGDAQGLVVRYSLPDSPDGRGTDATLSLYVNGKQHGKLPMTSRFSHLYGKYPFNNVPASGSPRNFWDEVRLMPGAIRAGDVIRIQKDPDDLASEYLIDLVDVETVPAPLEKPADALSVIEFGATANDSSDDRAAFLAAVSAAKAQKKAVWIPAGQFVVKGAIEVSDVAIRGAGMWYSTLVGVDDYAPQNRVAIYGTGSNVTLADFAIVGKLNYRNDSEPNDGIGESFGTGSSIRNVWVEHTKAGAWIVNSDGLVIEGCRFRNNIADGINLCIGMRNTVVRNCTARGTGDDCFAMWPATYKQSIYTHGSNRFVNCTGQLPFLAQAFSIYGGEGNRVEGCEASDIPYGAGLFASTTFPTEFGFRGVTSFSRNRITRAGGTDGAVGTFANLVDLAGVRFEDIDVLDSAADAVKFTSVKERALRDARFDRIRIENVGLAGGDGHAFFAAPGAVGSATVRNVTVRNVKTKAWRSESRTFELIQGDGNVGLEDARQSMAK